jgi:hypothetical protein
VSQRLEVDLNAVLVAVTAGEPRILVVEPSRSGDAPSQEAPALPFGSFDPVSDRTLELGLRRWVYEQTGLSLDYVEQLYTFGDRDRYKAAGGKPTRLLSVAYLALLHEQEPAAAGAAHWRNCYDLLPWEDRRNPVGRNRALAGRLDSWLDEDPTARGERRERRDVAFGLGKAGWNGDRVLDRYELLYEAGAVEEAVLDGQLSCHDDPPLNPDSTSGRSMFFDHRRIVATALGRLRGKIRYRPVVFELLPPTFTLLQLQKVVEALSGIDLHKQNFRRLIERGGLVEGTGQLDTHTGGRPAELFRYRPDVVRERPAPGVGLPGLPTTAAP